MSEFLAIGAFVYVLIAVGIVAAIFLINSFQDIQSAPQVLWLGAETIELNSALSAQYNISTADGLLVSRTFLGSPAETGDLKVGDVIQRWNGISITSQRQMGRLIGKSVEGQKITLSIIRKDKPAMIFVRLGVRPGGTPVT